MTIKPIRPRENAIEKIEQLILDQNLSAHSRLPSERELCELWGLSRTTIRSAIDFLIGVDVLYRVKGSGTFIADEKKTRNIIGVNTLTRDFRERGVMYSTEILNFQIVKASKRVAEKLKILEGDEVYQLIRLRSLKSTPSFIETMYLDAKMVPNLDEYYSEKSSIHAIYRNVYNIRPVGGRESISVTYATEAEASLLNINERAPLFLTSGVTFNEDKIPLEYYKIVFRADHFRFVYMIENNNFRKEEEHE